MTAEVTKPRASLARTLRSPLRLAQFSTVEMGRLDGRSQGRNPMSIKVNVIRINRMT